MSIEIFQLLLAPAGTARCLRLSKSCATAAGKSDALFRIADGPPREDILVKP